MSIGEDEIRETIYNTMLEVALRYDKTDLSTKLSNVDTRAFILRFLVSATIQEIDKSGTEYGYPTIRGKYVTMDNVPTSFHDLFKGLKHLSSLSDVNVINMTMANIVTAVEKKDIFKNIIVDFMKFYLESQTEIKEPIVTVEDIRSTFYQMMAEQVLVDGIISKEALGDQDSFIFFDLSSYVIIKSVLTSLKYNGILLYNGAVVTKMNCPEQYQNLYDVLMSLRSKIIAMKLNDKQLKVISICSSFNPDAKLPPDLSVLRTSEINSVISHIKDMAINISQIPYFKNIIASVINYCVEALG